MAETVNSFSSRIPYFLSEVLGSPAGSIPKGAQWVLSFDGIYGETTTNGKPGKILPIEAIKKGTAFEPGKWNIDQSIDCTVSDKYQTSKGCMFIQAVNIPGESVTTLPEGIQYNGFLRTQIGGGRADQNVIQLSFLETNVSFVDNTLRAWLIATSHLGLIARSGADNYRGNISVYRLGTTTADEPPFVSQHFQFFGACPITIEGDEWNYSNAISFRPRSVSFTYHYYTLDTVTGNKFLTTSSSSQETINGKPEPTIASTTESLNQERAGATSSASQETINQATGTNSK